MSQMVLQKSYRIQFWLFIKAFEMYMHAKGRHFTASLAAGRPERCPPRTSKTYAFGPACGPTFSRRTFLRPHRRRAAFAAPGFSWPGRRALPTPD